MAKLNAAFLADPRSPRTNAVWRIARVVAPPEVDIRIVDPSQSEGELIEQLAGVHAVIPWMGARLPVSLARQCRNLRLVQLLTAGYDPYDVAGLKESGVALANNGGANAISVSEHAVSLMLAVYRRLMASWENTRAGRWRQGLDDLPLRAEVTGKTVGIVGFGNIGRQVARRLAGWDAELLYHDIIEAMPGRDLELSAKQVPFDDLLARADIVTLHVPLNRSTRGMMGEREFGLMKPSAILINTCRGAVVDERALIRALQAGEIAGAGLDVFEEEPTPPDNPLLAMDNVVATPHWAGGTREGGERALRFAFSNLARLADGRALLSVVEPER